MASRSKRGFLMRFACTCCNHKKTLPTGDLDLLAIAQNLASARTFCKLEYCLNEKFTPYCLDKSPIYPRSRDVSSLFKFNHNLIFKEDKVQRTPKNSLFPLEISRKTDKILFYILWKKKSTKVDFSPISCKKAPFYTRNGHF